MKNLILIVIVVLVCSCHAKKGKNEKDAELNQIMVATGHNHSQNHGVSNDNNKSLESLSINELLVVNRNISARMRNDYRSWSYNEPDRWSSLAENFSNDVICSCPEASAKKKEIAQSFLNYLNKRAKIYNSDAKNKGELTGQSNLEFKYNLTFLVGVEGYQKWESDSKSQGARFNQMRDSLNAVISLI